MSSEFEIKDSGERTEFHTGAVRDMGGNKPRPDLISPFFLHRVRSELLKYVQDLTTPIWRSVAVPDMLVDLHTYLDSYSMGCKGEDMLAKASIVLLTLLHSDSDEGVTAIPNKIISPYALMRVGEHMRKGAEKYGEHNWEKGIPNSVCLASATRHILKYEAGYTDEDHLAAAVFNIMAMIHNEEVAERRVTLLVPDAAALVDVPVYDSSCKE